MSIDATVGGASSDSYITVAQAASYFEGRLYTTSWDDANTATRELSLRMSTNELDKMGWRGDIADSTTPQSLRWPRTGIFDLDDNAVLSTIIPTFLIDATSELALALLEKNRYAENDATGLRKVTAGEVAISWDRRWQNTRNPIVVNQLISPYLLHSSSANYTLLDRA